MKDRANIEAILKQPPGKPHSETFHHWNQGYVNWTAGWAHAEGAMRKLRTKLEAMNRVKLVFGEIKQLQYGKTADGNEDTVTGALLVSGQQVTADLTILATGSWTPILLDLHGIASAVGEILCYMNITDEEQAAMAKNPTMFDMSNLFFLVPPNNNVIRTAQHAYGYANFKEIPYPEPIDSFAQDHADKNGANGVAGAPKTYKVSLPWTARNDPNLRIPNEEYRNHLKYLHGIHPCLSDRKFDRVRICWYLDTVTADFRVSYHPRYSHTSPGGVRKGLFVATGGSGHAFKFLPVLGDKIVSQITGTLDPVYADRWTWPKKRIESEHVYSFDAWRGGRRGMDLSVELAKP